MSHPERTLPGMTSAAKKLLDDALALPEAEREALVEVLMTSLRYGGARTVEREWVAEVEKRMARLESGESAAIDWAEARDRLRVKYGFE